MTSELLDDYEEGTWTPTDYSGGRTFGSGTWGLYNKVGRWVTVSCYIDVAQAYSTNANDPFCISSLPYTPLDPGSGGFVGTLMIRQVNVSSTAYNLTLYTTDGTNGIRIYQQQDAGDWLDIENDEIPSNCDIYGQIQYLVS